MLLYAIISCSGHGYPGNGLIGVFTDPAQAETEAKKNYAYVQTMESDTIYPHGTKMPAITLPASTTTV